MEATQLIDDFGDIKADTPASDLPDDREVGSLSAGGVSYPLFLGVNVIGRQSTATERDRDRMHSWEGQFEGLPVHGVFLESASISATHAAIFIENRGAFCFIKDLGSRNRTFLSRNGKLSALQQGDRYALNSGDAVKFGSLDCEVNFHPLEDTDQQPGCPSPAPIGTGAEGKENAGHGVGEEPRSRSRERSRTASPQPQVKYPPGPVTSLAPLSLLPSSPDPFIPGGRPSLTVRTRPSAPVAPSDPTARPPSPVRKPTGPGFTVAPPPSPFIGPQPSNPATAPFPIPKGRPAPIDRLPSLRDGMGGIQLGNAPPSGASSGGGLSAQRQPSLSDWMLTGSGSFNSTGSGLFDRAGLPCSAGQGTPTSKPTSPAVPALWLKGWALSPSMGAHRSPTISEGGCTEAPMTPSDAGGSPAASAEPPHVLSGFATPWSEERMDTDAPPTPCFGVRPRFSGPFSPDDPPSQAAAAPPSTAEVIAEALSSAHLGSAPSADPGRARSPAPKRCRSPPSDRSSPVSRGTLARSKSPRLEMHTLTPAMGLAGPGGIARGLAK